MSKKRQNLVCLLLSRETGLGDRNGSSHLSKVFAEEKATIPSHNEACELSGQCRSTFLMTFSPDGRRVASAHGDHTVRVSDLNSGKCSHVLRGHKRSPWCIAFHPSRNNILASGCLGGEVRIWDLLGGGSEVWSPQKDTVIASLTFHPTDQVLVIATHNQLYFWDWSRQEPFASCKTASDRERVRWVKFDSLGHSLYTGIAHHKASQEDAVIDGQQVSFINDGVNSPSRRNPENMQRFRQTYYNLLNQINSNQRSRINESYPWGSGIASAISARPPEVRTFGGANVLAPPPHAEIDLIEPRSPVHQETLDTARENLDAARDYAARVTRITREALTNARRYAAQVTAESQQASMESDERLVVRIRNEYAMNRESTDSDTTPRPQRLGSVVPSTSGSLNMGVHLPPYGRNASSNLSSAPILSPPPSVPSAFQPLNHTRDFLNRVSRPARGSSGLSMTSWAAAGREARGSATAASSSAANVSDRLPTVSAGPSGSINSLSSSDTATTSTASSSANPGSSGPSLFSGHQSILRGQLTSSQSASGSAGHDEQPSRPDTGLTDGPGAACTSRCSFCRHNQAGSAYSSAPLSGSRENLSGTRENLRGNREHLSGNREHLCFGRRRILLRRNRPSLREFLQQQQARNRDRPGDVPEPQQPPGQPRPGIVNLQNFLENEVQPVMERVQSQHMEISNAFQTLASLRSEISAQELNQARQNPAESLTGELNNNDIEPVRAPAPEAQPPTSSARSASIGYMGDNEMRTSNSEPERTLPTTEALTINVGDGSGTSNSQPTGISDDMDDRLEHLDSLDRSMSEIQQRLRARMRLLREQRERRLGHMNRFRAASEQLYGIRLRLEERRRRLRAHIADIRQRYLPSNSQRMLFEEEDEPDEPANPTFIAGVPQEAAQEELPPSPPSLPEASVAGDGRLSVDEDRDWHALERRMLHPHYAVSILDDTINRQDHGLQAAINRAIAGVYVATGDTAVANNIVSLTHRIQRWDFSKCCIPDITQANANVVVPHCKLHNDSSCDISADGRYLATFVPIHRGFPDDTVLAIYSLLPETFGECLYTKSFGPNAISVSLSPLSNYVLVGLASKKLAWVLTPKQMVAQVYRLKTPKAGEDSMEHLCDLMHPCELDVRNNVSVNATRWLPMPGEGLVYGTNRGDLHICRPGFEDQRKGSDSGSQPASSGATFQRNLMQMLGVPVPHTASAATQTVVRVRRSASTQTDPDHGPR